MNSLRSWMHAAVAALFLAAIPGCLEIGVKTTVNTDGSCDREITLKRDSKAMPSTAFPIPVDSTWQTSWSQVGDSSKTYLYTARKHFDDFKQLALEYTTRPDSEKLTVAVYVGKKFRWFYTYYNYWEAFRVFNPLALVPASEMLTKDEIRLICSGDTSDSLKKKYEAWEERNYCEFFYRALLDGARTLNDPTLTPAMVESKKEQLLPLMKDAMNGTEKESGKLNAFVQALVRLFATHAVEGLEPNLEGAMNRLMRLSEVKGKADATYSYAVVMPGLLLDTNSDDVKGTTASWKFESKQFSMADYEMWAESRVVNVWAFVVTAIVALGLVALLVVPKLRRRKV
jgi:hypothetical protein